MKPRLAFVTGAAGFIGSQVVRALSRRGIFIKAGIHRQNSGNGIAGLEGVELVSADILDPNSLRKALEGVDILFHFAALVDAHTTRENLQRINVDGTRNVWSCAAAAGVQRALYCSSAAVYGLLTRAHQPVSEEVKPRSVEPYGHSKLLGEQAALEIAGSSGLSTIVIRPVAVFGPGQHTPFGRQLRAAIFSRILLAGGFQHKRFNFVHVEDVAEAAAHLMLSTPADNRIFNIAVDESILFEDAFQAYLQILSRLGQGYARTRMLARVSAQLNRFPSFSRWIRRVAGDRFAFTLWQPGFDLTYSSKKILTTSFQFKWSRFEDILESCAGKDS
jgi:nucleoside-diphosphate-sugar epimerase